jgi:hypothetical protein
MDAEVYERGCPAMGKEEIDRINRISEINIKSQSKRKKSNHEITPNFTNNFLFVLLRVI